MTHDLDPLTPPFDAAVQAAFDRYYPSRDGALLSLFRVFARSPRLLTKLGAGGLLGDDSPLPMRFREIVILRVTANNTCEYEWGVHVAAFSTQVRLTAEQIKATRGGSAVADCWTAQESTLIRVVDELCAHGRMSETTRTQFGDLWASEAQLEILALCGFYHTVSFIANTAKLAPESWAARFA